MIPTSQNNLFRIPRNGTTQRRKLNFILLNQQINIIHNRSINGTIQKRRLIQHAIHQIRISKRAVIKGAQRQISILQLTVVKDQVRELVVEVGQ